MTDDQLREWKRLADAAEVGPWEACQTGDSGLLFDIYRENDNPIADGVVGDNAAFIAAAREAVPALIQHIEELQAGIWAQQVAATVPDGSLLLAEVLQERDRLRGIVRDLAAKEPPVYDGMYCHLCRFKTEDEDHGWWMRLNNHAAFCPWRRAKEATDR